MNKTTTNKNEDILKKILNKDGIWAKIKYYFNYLILLLIIFIVILIFILFFSISNYMKLNKLFKYAEFST